MRPVVTVGSSIFYSLIGSLEVKIIAQGHGIDHTELEGHSYNPLIQIRGSRSHRGRPQFSDQKKFSIMHTF